MEIAWNLIYCTKIYVRELHFVAKFLCSSRFFEFPCRWWGVHITLVNPHDKDHCSEIEDKMSLETLAMSHANLTDNANCFSSSWICKSRAWCKRWAEGRECIERYVCVSQFRLITSDTYRLPRDALDRCLNQRERSYRHEFFSYETLSTAITRMKQIATWNGALSCFTSFDFRPPFDLSSEMFLVSR